VQALSFSQTGDLSALALVERLTPTPREGEVLVEVKAAGLMICSTTLRRMPVFKQSESFMSFSPGVTERSE